jgi:hypothetical protein
LLIVSASVVSTRPSTGTRESLLCENAVSATSEPN